jgi:hypothetical protein
MVKTRLGKEPISHRKRGVIEVRIWWIGSRNVFKKSFTVYQMHFMQILYHLPASAEPTLDQNLEVSTASNGKT